jgi:hypothetical protein
LAANRAGQQHFHITHTAHGIHSNTIPTSSTSPSNMGSQKMRSVCTALLTIKCVRRRSVDHNPANCSTHAMEQLCSQGTFGEASPSMQAKPPLNAYLLLPTALSRCTLLLGYTRQQLIIGSWGCSAAVASPPLSAACLADLRAR